MACYELPLTKGWLLTHIPCAGFYGYPLATLAHCFHVLTWPSLRVFQFVSAYVTRSVGFFLSRNKFLLLPSPASEWASLGWFLSMS